VELLDVLRLWPFNPEAPPDCDVLEQAAQAIRRLLPSATPRRASASWGGS
jgi:hypothetical protein